MLQRIKRIGISLCAMVLVLSMVGSLAAPAVPVTTSAAEKSSGEIQKEIDELEKEKKEIQQQIKDLQGQMSDNMDDMEAVVAQKNLIDQEIFLLYEQVVNINSQITRYRSLIADKQLELDAAQKNLDDLKERNKQRIRAMEKNSTTSYWSVIFKADNFLDMLDRLNTITKINQADQKMIEELRVAKEEVATAKEALEIQKTQLETTKKELDDAQVVLEEKRAEADELLNQLVAKGEEYMALVMEAEAAKSDLETEIEDLEDEYDAAKYQEYLEWLASQPPKQPSTPSNTGGTGGASNVTAGITWLIPCSYTRVSSAYGWRTHPVYGDQRFHHGIDLSASSGTPIVATRSGKVTIATFSNSAGYYVNIDHGDGFMSRYLHMTHYIVSPGQQVTAGQTIGYVGSTGVSKGAHLHFSLYYNGASVNPAAYINF